MSDYPEHDKLSAISEQSQEIGRFLDEFLPSKGINLLRWIETEEQVECDGGLMAFHCRWLKYQLPCNICKSTGIKTNQWAGWVPAHEQINTLLAEFYGIDQVKLEHEKRAMLADLGKANGQ